MQLIMKLKTFFMLETGLSNLSGRNSLKVINNFYYYPPILAAYKNVLHSKSIWHKCKKLDAKKTKIFFA